MSESLTETLIRYEVLRLRPYTDSVGKLTIGVARNLDNLGISREEAGNGQNHGSRGHRERYGAGSTGIFWAGHLPGVPEKRQQFFNVYPPVQLARHAAGHMSLPNLRSHAMSEEEQNPVVRYVAPFEATSRALFL